jgi:hypothetical protein
MSEGATISVDFGDVWTAVTDVARTLDTEATTSLADNVFVIPKCVSAPGDLTGWYGTPGVLQQGLRYTSIASEYFGTSETKIRFGVSWYFGGRLNGNGRYIGNADVYAIVDGLGLGSSFEIDGQFDNPLTMDNYVAQLSGQLHIKRYYWRMLEDSYRYQFYIRGDGAGQMWVL